MASVTDAAPWTIDLASSPVRELNQLLHDLRARPGDSRPDRIEVVNPNGSHNVAVGAVGSVTIDIRGHVGYYAGAMNAGAQVTVHGNAGKGAAENIMSGTVRIKGSASDCAGATGHGGLVVVEGNAASRCGISMKGCDIVVRGSVGHISGFMAQTGYLVVCEDAGGALGDSLYEAVIYVGGKIDGLGADAREEPMTSDDRDILAALLRRADFDVDTDDFKRVASAKALYHWDSEHPSKYG